MTGYVRISRSILEWDWYKNINTCKLFFHMLLKANWDDRKFQGIEVPCGSFVSSIRELAAETGLSVQNVKTALIHLREAGELTQYQHGKISVFTVKNYDVYVKSNPQSNPETNPQSNPKLTHMKEKKNIKIKEIYTRAHARGTGFSNFPEREYDMDELEKQLLACQNMQEVNV